MVVVTEVAINMPNETMDSFGETKRAAFKQAVADTVGVSASDITLSVKAASAGAGRRLADGLTVEVFISQTATQVDEIAEVGMVLKDSTFDTMLTEALAQSAPMQVAVQVDTIAQEHLAEKPSKDCSTFTSGAIHWAERKLTNNWGPYVEKPYVSTQEKCIADCNDEPKCFGWAWRKGTQIGPDGNQNTMTTGTHVNYQKCFLLDATHVGYAPHLDSLTNGPANYATHLNEFNSGVCTNV